MLRYALSCRKEEREGLMLVHFFLGVNYLTDFPFYQLKFKLSEIDVRIPTE